MKFEGSPKWTRADVAKIESMADQGWKVLEEDFLEIMSAAKGLTKPSERIVWLCLNAVAGELSLRIGRASLDE